MWNLEVDEGIAMFQRQASHTEQSHPGLICDCIQDSLETGLEERYAVLETSLSQLSAMQSAYPFYSFLTHIYNYSVFTAKGG